MKMTVSQEEDVPCQLEGECPRWLSQ